MKKFISILAAGALMLSTTSVFAAIPSGTTVYTQDFETLVNVNNSNDIPAEMKGDGSSGTQGYLLENNVASTYISGHDKGNGDYALKFVPNKAGSYLKLIPKVDANYFVFEQDLKITAGGFGVYIGQHYGASGTEKTIMRFDDDGYVYVEGYTGRIRQSWNKNEWYKLRILYTKATGIANSMTSVELYDNSGSLLCRWIGKTTTANTNTAANTMRRFSFVSRTADSELYLDNVKVYELSAYSETIFNVVDNVERTVAKEISEIKGKEIVLEISFANPSFTATTPKLMLASYDSNGRMLQCVIGETIAKVNVGLSRATLEKVDANAASVKAFAWDLGTLKPIVDPVLID